MAPSSGQGKIGHLFVCLFFLIFYIFLRGAFFLLVICFCLFVYVPHVGGRKTSSLVGKTTKKI